MSAADCATFEFVLKEKTRILVVDDDPIMREFACVYLAGPATVIETAPDAEAALAALERGAFDIALFDIEMPGMNGIELVRTIRSGSTARDLPVVMVTGLDDIVSIDAAYNGGATSFVTKPVNWRLLNYHLRFVLRAQESPEKTHLADERSASPRPLVRRTAMG